MTRVSSTMMWRIKNRPANSISCSDDDALRLLVLVAGRLYWGLRVTSLFSIWGCVLKGRIAFEGHWRHQSWTLVRGSCWFFLFVSLRLVTFGSSWHLIRSLALWCHFDIVYIKLVILLVLLQAALSSLAWDQWVALWGVIWTKKIKKCHFRF